MLAKKRFASHCLSAECLGGLLISHFLINRKMITAFVGKGGVGKTSVASAYAELCSRHGRTALVSTDFMRTLPYIFPRRPESLHIVEMSGQEVADSWKRAYGKEVMEVLNEAVEAEEWMLDHVALSPGVAEEFMISSIVDMEDSGKYDFVIWDTAASSSTMHLIYLQKEFYGHLDRDVRILMGLRERFRISKAKEVLDRWKALSNKVWKSLQRASFNLVTTMDELSVNQSEEISRDLTSMGMRVDGTVCNRFIRTCSSGVKCTAVIPELHGSAAEIVQAMVPYLEAMVEASAGSISDKSRL